MKSKLVLFMSGLVMVSCAAEDKKSGPLFSEQEIREYQVRAPKDVPYLVMKVNAEGEEEVLYYRGDVSFLDTASRASNADSISIKNYDLSPVNVSNYITGDIYGGTSFNNYSSYYKYSPNTYCYKPSVGYTPYHYQTSYQPFSNYGGYGFGYDYAGGYQNNGDSYYYYEPYATPYADPGTATYSFQGQNLRETHISSGYYGNAQCGSYLPHTGLGYGEGFLNNYGPGYGGLNY